jgi:predicted Na+-dependent transporter
MLFHQIQLMVCALLAQRWAALRTIARQPSSRRETSF